MRAARLTPSPKMCPSPVDDDLAEMHADAEHQPPLLGQHLVLARHAFLDIDRRRDRGLGRAEFGEQGIARAVDQRAAGDLDGRPPDSPCADLRCLTVRSSSPSIRRTKPATSA